MIIIFKKVRDSLTTRLVPDYFYLYIHEQSSSGGVEDRQAVERIRTHAKKTRGKESAVVTTEKDCQQVKFKNTAKSIVAESNVNESVCDAEVVDEIAEKTIATDSKVISEEANPDNEQSTFPTTHASSTYQQGIDDFYQIQAES